MRIGQVSAIQFGSKIVTSLGGFAATLYFARTVGSDTLGVYFLLLATVGWISIIVEAGISPAIIKRMSEGEKPGEYFQVGLVIIAIGTGIITLLIFVFSKWVTDYVSHPYSTYFLIILVVSGAAMTAVRSGLSGSRNVHISGMLTTLQSTLRIFVQVSAVTIGLGLSGLVFGWVLSALTVSVIGFVYLVLKIGDIPTLGISRVDELIKDLYSFAKYSWLGSLKSKTNNYADILVLGLFVQSDLIAAYAVSWNIASFLTILGSAIETTLFPEFSQLENNNNYDEIATLLKKSVQYTGLFVIPGFFGGILLGDRILRLYGPDFVIGAKVLFLLIGSVLIYDYQKQLTSVLQGINRPDVDFRVNGLFIVSNIIFNFVLIPIIGWRGAAVATVISSFVSLLYAYYSVSQLIEFSIPIAEIIKQITASVLMLCIVYTLEHIESSLRIIGNNAIAVFILVIIGGTTYIGTLIVISRDTRKTVVDNLSIEIDGR